MDSFSDEEEMYQQPAYGFQEQWRLEGPTDQQGARNSDYKMKIDLPTFNGKTDLDWIEDVKNFFDYMNTPKDKKVKLVAKRRSFEVETTPN